MGGDFALWAWLAGAQVPSSRGVRGWSILVFSPLPSLNSGSFPSRSTWCFTR